MEETTKLEQGKEQEVREGSQLVLVCTVINNLWQLRSDLSSIHNTNVSVYC